jgi:hypothetical protein
MSVEMIKEVYFRNSDTQVLERDRQLGLKKILNIDHESPIVTQVSTETFHRDRSYAGVTLDVPAQPAPTMGRPGDGDDDGGNGGRGLCGRHKMVD